MNDPGRRQVRQIYRRDNFERAWKESENTVYLIYPTNHPVPSDHLAIGSPGSNSRPWSVLFGIMGWGDFVKGAIGSVKDSGASVAIKSWLGRELADYGEVIEFKMNSRERMAELQILLKGEARETRGEDRGLRSDQRGQRLHYREAGASFSRMGERGAAELRDRPAARDSGAIQRHGETGVERMRFSC